MLPKSKIITFIILIFIFYVISTRNDGIDYGSYANEYAYAVDQQLSDVHYVGWLMVEKLCLILNFDFVEFVVFIAFLCCGGLYFGVKNLTENINCVLSLFLIYPFGYEAVQMRTFLADAIVLCGLPLILVNNEINKCQKLIGFGCISFVASLVHFLASFYFLVFIVVYSLPKRYVKHFVIATAIILTIFLKIGILNNFLVLLNSRVEFWLSSIMGYGWVVPVFFTLGIFAIIFYSGSLLLQVNYGHFNLFENWLIAAYSIILLLPLFCIDATFDRLWRVFLILAFISSSNVIYGKIDIKKKITLMFLLIITLGGISFYESEFEILDHCFLGDF